MRNHSASLAQLGRFVIAGSFSTLFNYAIYACLVFFGLQYALANLIALVASVLFSFKAQSAFVFRKSGERRLGRFVVAWACLYLGNTLAIKALLDAGHDEYIAGAIATVPTALLSYATMRLFVYR